MSIAPPAALLLAALALSGCAEPETAVTVADLVLQNARVVSVDPEIGEAEAVAVRAGRILAVGSQAEIEPHVGPDTRVIDLDGKLLVPGFIEGHGHFMGVGEARLILDLREASDWSEIVEQVAEAVAAAEPGEVVRGRGWHQDKWIRPPEPQVEGFPLHASLSAVSPDNPVVLTHASGHAAFVNAAALERAGIDRETPDPPGGEILRTADGEATGLLRETAQRLVRGEVLVHAGGEGVEIAPATVERMIALASEECLAKGVTTFTDAGSSFETIDRLVEAAENGTLGVRLWMMVRDSYDDLVAHLPDYKGDLVDDRLTVGGIKLSIDGALGSRGAWLLEPYSDQPDSTGLNLIPVDEVRRTAELAMAEDYQLCVHAIGDRANREVLDIFEETFAAHPEADDLRWRIEHAQHLHPD
ncbi:MAG: amidohydrolase, partial [Thermoanaerobaculia bacterium]|nr:amidohydrolase [Thermoanaerobaculia bacterium]